MQVAIPAVTVCELHPVIELKPFLKLTVPVAAFELTVAVRVFVAPYVVVVSCVVKVVVDDVGNTAREKVYGLALFCA